MDEELQQYREDIRKTDEQMALLFLRRMRASERILSCKNRLGMPVEDPEQEKNVISRNLHIIPEGDLFRSRNHHALALLEHPDKIRRIHQAVHRSRIQPGKAAAKNLNIEETLFQIEIVQRCDFQFAPGARTNLVRHGGHAGRIEV